MPCCAWPPQETRFYPNFLRYYEKRLQVICLKAESALSDLYKEAGKLEYESEQNRS